ncbi:MAG TPA: PKD domain-containing protein, partial [Bdellovibrionales bacterium]|nr:PKD domain-containing protein [Bdellovibrionales bacterium]
IVNFYTNEPIVDPDGTVDTIRWEFGDGTTQEFNAGEFDDYGYVQHVYPAPGHYTVKLTLIDNSSDETVYSEYADIANGQIPEPIFEVSASSGASPLMVNFFATGVDPEDRLASYNWEFGDGNSVDGPIYQTASNEYTTSGTYQ